MTMPQVAQEAAALLKLGVAFMASSFMTVGAVYVIRIIVLRNAGFDAAGLYQAARALGGQAPARLSVPKCLRQPFQWAARL